jgi:hypothetical protein
MTQATQLIKKLARLKYLSLSKLFGRQVMIYSVDTVEENIRLALYPWLIICRMNLMSMMNFWKK